MGASIQLHLDNMVYNISIITESSAHEHMFDECSISQILICLIHVSKFNPILKRENL